LKFNQRDIEGGVIVDLKGKFSGGPEADGLRDLFKSSVAKGTKNVVVNLKDVEWIASPGIGVLMSGLKAVREAGGEFILVHVGQRSQQVFNVMRLDRIFKIVDSEDEAVRYLKESS
jgi:anti-sigma B factor antagonist